MRTLHISIGAAADIFIHVLRMIIDLFDLFEARRHISTSIIAQTVQMSNLSEIDDENQNVVDAVVRVCACCKVQNL